METGLKRALQPSRSRAQVLRTWIRTRRPMKLTDQLDRLSLLEPAPYPVVSLYLNTQPGPVGRDQYQAFIRKEFAGRADTYPQGSPERESLDRDLERINRYLENELQPSSNGVAMFACSAGELF